MGVVNIGAAENLKEIINRQKEVLSALESEQRAIESTDLAKENISLKEELEKLRADFESASSRATELAKENSGLRNKLYEQTFNEKVSIVNTSTRKLEIYFRAHVGGELNRLTVLENSVKSRADNIRKILAQNHIAARDDIYERLDELLAILDVRLTEARRHAARTTGAFTQQEREELEALKNEQISDEQMRALAKKNNLERFVGLNVLNVIGVFLLIIGVITLARFASWLLSDMIKGILLFAFGGAMLAGGEILNRKKPNIFSLGISAGGVGILYAALATSYFGLHILGMYPAILVCVLITAVAFVLSDRYNSQTIAAFALIGGYLPMYSIGSDSGAAITYGAMVYFIALNLFALSVSFSKKWRISSFIGLVLNTLGTVYICSRFFVLGVGIDKVLTILYVLFAFLIYTAIPIVSTYRTGSKFRKSDIVMLAINTFFSSLIMYGVFYNFNLQDFNGLLAVCFAAIYLLLGRVIEKKFSAEERYARVLFYLTGLAFVILVVPLQFGRAWLSLGWLAEGVLLAVYGILTDEIQFRRIGLIICLLCLGAFVVFDCIWPYSFLFVYKYLAITLGSLAILGAYMYKRMMTGSFIQIYKYFALVNAWLYVMYLILNKLMDALASHFSRSIAYQTDYLCVAAAVVATFFMAYGFPRIKLLSDTGIKVLSIVLYSIGILVLALINTAGAPVDYIYLQVGTPAPGITVMGTVILAALGILSVLALREIMKIIVTEQKLGIEWYPLIISGYSVVILTQNMITQYKLAFSSALISIIYGLAALAWIVYGFAKRYSYMRKFGLGLAVLSVIKVFLVDLASLTRGYQIVTYFALGITLIAISFVYQYFSKRLEQAEGGAADVEKGEL